MWHWCLTLLEHQNAGSSPQDCSGILQPSPYVPIHTTVAEDCSPHHLPGPSVLCWLQASASGLLMAESPTEFFSSSCFSSLTQEQTEVLHVRILRRGLCCMLYLHTSAKGQDKPPTTSMFQLVLSPEMGSQRDQSENLTGKFWYCVVTITSGLDLLTARPGK